uniref:KIB1-4 beta-propeller domain-containing protein n=1 Tax=Oryza barthii TaxID=65489 RepID=A0A0D3GCH1_9ORYZ
MSASTSRRPAAPSPFLVLYDDADGGRPATTTLYNVADGVHRPCDIDDQRTKRSWVTSHGGWVLTWDSATLATFLWNPYAAAAGETTNVALPSFGRAPPDIEACCALSTGEPAAAGGGLFTVVMVEVDSNVLWYCHAGATSSSSSPAWAKHEYDIGDERTISGFTPCGGKLYYLIQPGMSYGVLEFSPDHQPVFTTVRAKPIRLFATAEDCMLVFSVFPVDVNGELHLVFIFKGEDCKAVVDVAVYRVYLEKRKHVRIRSIGDRAILVGGSNGFGGWCRASRHGLLPNSIYWVSPFDNRLHVYDLGEKTEEIRDPCKGVADQTGVQEYLPLSVS